jgi:chemosensory pili system protein ChpA (sensor histidine kinase/response regulator)
MPVQDFVQAAAELLQYLREYAGQLQESHARREDIEGLYTAAHTLSESGAAFGFPLFSEVAGKLAHVFQYALNVSLSPDLYGPLTEFMSDGIAVLESDLLQIGSGGTETIEELEAFKRRYSFAFPAPIAMEEAAPAVPPADAVLEAEAQHIFEGTASFYDRLPADNDVSEDILGFFMPEAEEHLQVVTECLLALEGNPNPDEINRLFRSMHTVKGSAAQVGLHRISAIAHRVEDVLGRLRDGILAPSTDLVDLCLDAVDVLKKLLHRESKDESAIRQQVDQLFARVAELVPEDDSAESAGAAASSAATGYAASTSPTKTVAASKASAAKLVRVPLDRLDRMMNVIGELVINRTRMVGRLAELEKLTDILNLSKSRLHAKVADFQEKYEFNRITNDAFPKSEGGNGEGEESPFTQAPPLNDPLFAEFSELELDRYDDFNILSRSLTEISADVTEVLSQLNSFSGRVESDIDEFTKLTHHVRDEITVARMVRIGNLFTRVTRAVRDAAREASKQVSLEMTGAETQLDNNIIQQVADPLLHLVRNAVAHGIEPAHERAAAGKSPQGKVTVRAYHRGNHIHIEVEDDGRGIDSERIRSSAVAAGLLSTEGAANLSDRELREFLFRPGFSTASSKTALAGRGVGLDVVRANLDALNGEIDIRTASGLGTCFTLKVPLTLIISTALFVRCGKSLFALPLAVVEEIRRVRRNEIEEIGGQFVTRVRDDILEVVRLDAHLGLPPLEAINDCFHMVIVQVTGRRVGLIVEEVQGKDEIVLKNLGAYLCKVKLFPGTTIAPDGSLILLLDVNRLVAHDSAQTTSVQPSASAVRVFAPGAEAAASGSIPAEATDAVGQEKVVLVVDDSISIRKFVGRILDKAGYVVRLASDGLEATEIISHVGCHLLITDIEMPRMNGYELMAHLRQGPETRSIPILVITSRAGAKHRDRAMKEGATGFLTKPVQEEQLLGAVAQLIGASATALQPSPAGWTT